MFCHVWDHLWWPSKCTKQCILHTWAPVSRFFGNLWPQGNRVRECGKRCLLLIFSLFYSLKAILHLLKKLLNDNQFMLLDFLVLEIYWNRKVQFGILLSMDLNIFPPVSLYAFLYTNPYCIYCNYLLVWYTTITVFKLIRNEILYI